MDDEQAKDDWPPSFTLDQERILNLLTGDRFYSNASAALREAILNAIDAVYRRRLKEPTLKPCIIVEFNSHERSLCVSDNGDGMNRQAVSMLFTKVGASAARLDGGGSSVGEFGIGVISYFMAGDAFSIQTYSGTEEPIALKFTREMLAGGTAQKIAPTRTNQGTTITIEIRDQQTLELLLKNFPHWCRDVAGLEATHDKSPVQQGGYFKHASNIELNTPSWIERVHLSPVQGISEWGEMNGSSTIAILYKGVFVQEYQAKALWGIQGSIDVNPKHFKPKLNRESFVDGMFQAEIQSFLRTIHPRILAALGDRLKEALEKDALPTWGQRRWATLWLSLPRGGDYAVVAQAWDQIFRKVPAFELAIGNKWEAVSVERLLTIGDPVYIAPLPERPRTNTDVVNAALRLLRHTNRPVIRGIQPDKGWLREISFSFRTTADLIRSVFSNELPHLVSLESAAESLLTELKPVVKLYNGSPSVDLVNIGRESPPILRLQTRLIINLDHPKGKKIVHDALSENLGRWSLIRITALHSAEHLSQVSAAVKDAPNVRESLGLVKRRFISRLLA